MMKQAESNASSDAIPLSPLARRRAFFAAVLLLTFVLASVLAFLQPSAPSKPTSFLTQLLYPLQDAAVPILHSPPRFLKSITKAPDGNVIWAIDKNGKIIRSEDDGRSWPVATPVLKNPAPLPAVNPGKSAAYIPSSLWNAEISVQAKVAAPSPPDLTNVSFYAIYFITPNRGVASAENLLLSTTNGGQEWTYFIGDYQAPLLIYSFSSDQQNIYGVGHTHTVRQPRAAVELTNWELLSNDTSALFLASCITVQSKDKSLEPLLLAVGKAGVCSQGRLPDGKIISHFVVSSDQPLPDLFGLATTPDNSAAVAVGAQGALYRTTDAGDHWTRLPSPASDDLHQIQFIDPTHGFIRSNDGNTLLITSDGGLSWSYARTYPAPWYWIALALLAIPLLGLVRQKLPPITTKPSIADRLASDKPLTPSQTSPTPSSDPMDLNSIALGVSLFLANQSTLPPLTIAVTGPWGSGKSSLMNLVGGHLQRFGFRPASFNAWHHQKEESLLAALLEHVRRQAAPPLLSLNGLDFRRRLFLHRLQRRQVRQSLLLAAILFALFIGMGYANRDTFHHPEKLLDRLTAVRNIFNSGAHATQYFMDVLVPSLGLGSLVYFGRFLKKSLTAIGVNPAELLATSTTSSTPSQLSDQTSFRYRFQKEFADVTRSLNPNDHSLLIMIDDLDRCAPATVLETLEAVNFLTTSGDCFILLAMDRNVVEHSIAAHYAQLWQGSTPESSLTDARNPLRFARLYLEKLLNIEVQIPLPRAANIQRLLIPDRATSAIAEDSWRSRLLTATRVIATSGTFWVFTLIAAFLIGMRVPLDSPALQAVEHQDVQPATQRENPVPPPDVRSTALPAPAPTPATAPATQPFAFLFQAPAANPLFWIFPGALLITGAIIALSQRPRLTIEDSPQFNDALNIWLPVLAELQPTPRALKRFVNRVRYYAMRQRDPAQAEKRLDRRISWSQYYKGTTYIEEFYISRGQPISQESLVALAVVEECQRRSPDLGSLYSFLQNALSPTPSLLPPTFKDAATGHAARFHSDQPFTPAQVDQFIELRGELHDRLIKPEEER